jgi:hypothetical protein
MCRSRLSISGNSESRGRHCRRPRRAASRGCRQQTSQGPRQAIDAVVHAALFGSIRCYAPQHLCCPHAVRTQNSSAVPVELFSRFRNAATNAGMSLYGSQEVPHEGPRGRPGERPRGRPGSSKALLAVLESRGMRISKKARTRILASTDIEQTDAWLRKVASSVDELF